MQDTNVIVVGGRVCGEPELKTTPNGKFILKLTIANNTGFGEHANSNFFNCTFWAKDAEFVSKYVHKGDSMTVSGEINIKSYNSSKTNEKKIFVDITVKSFTTYKISREKAPELTEPEETVIEPTAQTDSTPQFVTIEDDEELPF